MLISTIADVGIGSCALTYFSTFLYDQSYLMAWTGFGFITSQPHYASSPGVLYFYPFMIHYWPQWMDHMTSHISSTLMAQTLVIFFSSYLLKSHLSYQPFFLTWGPFTPLWWTFQSLLTPLQFLLFTQLESHCDSKQTQLLWSHYMNHKFLLISCWSFLSTESIQTLIPVKC